MPENQPPAGQARARSRAATRERILAAAASHLALHGSDSTTIAAVARLAGVAAGTIYIHFPDKEALLREVLAEALGQLKLSLAEAASGRPARTHEDDVRQRTNGLVSFAEARPELASVLFHPAHLATASGRDTLEFLVESQAAALVEARDRGWVRADLDPALAGRALVGGLVNVLGWWLERRARGLPAPAAAAVVGTLASLRLYGSAERPRE